MFDVKALSCDSLRLANTETIVCTPIVIDGDFISKLAVQTFDLVFRTHTSLDNISFE